MSVDSRQISLCLTTIQSNGSGHSLRIGLNRFYPIKVNTQQTPINARTTRGVTNGKLIEEGTSNLMVNSCIGDATRLWNRAPEGIKTSKTLFSAKMEIKKFVSTLPI